MCSFSLDFVILLIYNVHVSIVCILTNLNKGLFSVCFISISLRGQFVCVRVASFVFLKFFVCFLCFMSTVHYVHKNKARERLA